jgi:hypothetical protein
VDEFIELGTNVGRNGALEIAAVHTDTDLLFTEMDLRLIGDEIFISEQHFHAVALSLYCCDFLHEEYSFLENVLVEAVFKQG